MSFARVGDEIRLTKSLTASMWGNQIPRGARGVVVSTAWSRLTVKIDTGTGFVTKTVPSSSVRVTRRAVGEHQFTSRSELMHLARLGVAFVMLAPFVVFTIRYVIATGSTDGLIETVALGLVRSTLEVVELAVRAPVATTVYLLVSWALWRFAFPK